MPLSENLSARNDLGTIPVEDISFIYNSDFEDPAMEKVILAPMPQLGSKPYRKVKAPPNAPPQLLALYETPLLSKEQEQHLFRKMNYLKFCAAQLHLQNRKSKKTLAAMERILSAAEEVRNQIVEANLRLSLNFAKKNHESLGKDLFDAWHDITLQMMRAADKFDYGRGNKFSTYATWAFIKNTMREKEVRQTKTIHATSAQFDMEDTRTADLSLEEYRETNKILLEKLFDGANIEQREKEILDLRTGLTSGNEMTLKEVGEKIGITKERVRQLQARAMRKIRAYIEITSTTDRQLHNRLEDLAG